jgi:hypothetical protein
VSKLVWVFCPPKNHHDSEKKSGLQETTWQKKPNALAMEIAQRTNELRRVSQKSQVLAPD